MGRGSSGAQKSTQRQSKKPLGQVAEQGIGQEQAQPTRRGEAIGGTKVQLGYIEYVAKQTGIDLNAARDPQFDNRRAFNIDTQKIGRTELATVRRLAQQYPGDYDVQFMANGAHRLAVFVKKRKR